MKPIDWATIITLFIIAVALIIGVYVLYKDEVNECTSNPFVFGAKELEKDYHYDIYGSIYATNVPTEFQSPIWNFNSTNIWRLQ